MHVLTLTVTAAATFFSHKMRARMMADKAKYSSHSRRFHFGTGKLYWNWLHLKPDTFDIRDQHIIDHQKPVFM